MNGGVRETGGGFHRISSRADDDVTEIEPGTICVTNLNIGTILKTHALGTASQCAVTTMLIGRRVAGPDSLDDFFFWLPFRY